MAFLWLFVEGVCNDCLQVESCLSKSPSLQKTSDNNNNLEFGHFSYPTIKLEIEIRVPKRQGY